MPDTRYGMCDKGSLILDASTYFGMRVVALLNDDNGGNNELQESRNLEIIKMYYNGSSKNDSLTASKI